MECSSRESKRSICVLRMKHLPLIRAMTGVIRLMSVLGNCGGVNPVTRSSGQWLTRIGRQSTCRSWREPEMTRSISGARRERQPSTGGRETTRLPLETTDHWQISVEPSSLMGMRILTRIPVRCPILKLMGSHSRIFSPVPVRALRRAPSWTAAVVIPSNITTQDMSRLCSQGQTARYRCDRSRWRATGKSKQISFGMREFQHWMSQIARSTSTARGNRPRPLPMEMASPTGNSGRAPSRMKRANRIRIDNPCLSIPPG